MDCCRLKSSSPSIKVSHSLYLLHQGAGLILIYIGSKMVTYVFYLVLYLQGQQNVLLYGFHRSKSELDVHSNFSSESFTTQFLREVSYNIVIRYLKY